ncbi:MAG: beta-lactamase family protein [Chitinophagaceae bacterium]|nr:beta-lactamase family protein [Rubrivivax sp.]
MKQASVCSAQHASHAPFGGLNRSRLLAVVALGLAFAGPAAAEGSFDSLTALANGALTGQNVTRPVPGFELLVLQHGQPLYHQAFGQWTAGQLANVDSSSKTMSAALLMSVTETHPATFQLDTKLSSLLPAFDRDDKRDISVRQAFSHTSGLSGSDVGSPILANPNITLQQAASLIAAQPTIAAAGTAFAYGGLSMQAAGAAAEVATGQAFVDLFQARIAGPLQLADTRFVLASDSNPRVAGGLASTARDFGRFMDMLLGQGVDRATGATVLSAASVNTMLTRQTTDQQVIINSPADNSLYGVGVWLDQLGPAGPTVDALAAGARGFHSWIDAASGLVFVFATDSTTFQNVERLSSMMHVAVLSAVPEPSGALLGMAGLGLVLGLRRRRLNLRGCAQRPERNYSSDAKLRRAVSSSGNRRSIT